MTHKNLRFRWAAFALAAFLLIPPAAIAGGARSLPEPEGPGILTLLWDFVSGLLLKSGETENRGQIDPDGLTADADPGLENRGQMDPNG